MPTILICLGADFTSSSTSTQVIDVPFSLGVVQNSFDSKGGQSPIIGKMTLFGFTEDGKHFAGVYGYIWEHDATNLTEIASDGSIQPTILNLSLETKWRINIEPSVSDTTYWMVYFEAASET